MTQMNLTSDYFKPETLKAGETLSNKPTTFLMDTFFNESDRYTTEEVTIEQGFFLDEVANFTQKGGEAELVNPKKVMFKRFKFPEIKLGMPFDVTMGQERLVGEEKYNSNLTPADRIRRQIDEIDPILSNMIKRKKEIMCSELLHSGKITIKEYADGQLASESLATFADEVRVDVDSKWNTPSVDIIGQLEKYADQLRMRESIPEIIIMGNDAWTAFSNDEKIMKKLDTNNYDIGQISPRLKELNQTGSNMIYLGMLNTGELRNIPIVKYSTWYFDKETKKKVGLIDPKTVIMAPLSLGIMSYGAITILEDGDEYHKTAIAEEYSTIKRNYNTQTISLEKISRPMPHPRKVNSWLSLGVLA